jgi:hypothetical protein
MGLLHLQPIVLLGPIFGIAALPMTSDGPIVFSIVAADACAWGHYFSGRCCRCTGMSLSNFQQQLPMVSLGPIILQGGFANALGWAHCA